MQDFQKYSEQIRKMIADFRKQKTWDTRQLLDIIAVINKQIDETEAAGGWPLRCVIRSASDVEPAFDCAHPHLPNGSQALVGQTAEL